MQIRVQRVPFHLLHKRHGSVLHVWYRVHVSERQNLKAVAGGVAGVVMWAPANVTQNTLEKSSGVRINHQSSYLLALAAAAPGGRESELHKTGALWIAAILCAILVRQA